MTALADARHQAGLLLRLRQMRMEVAARTLAAARTATARAEAARNAAHDATQEADSAHRAAREQLGDDLQEAERMLAIVDQARFREAVATQALDAALEDERQHREAEAEKRRAAIVARARHAGVEERAALLSRRIARRVEESEQMDFDDRRRPS